MSTVTKPKAPRKQSADDARWEELLANTPDAVWDKWTAEVDEQIKAGNHVPLDEMLTHFGVLYPTPKV